MAHKTELRTPGHDTEKPYVDKNPKLVIPRFLRATESYKFNKEGGVTVNPNHPTKDVRWRGILFLGSCYSRVFQQPEHPVKEEE